VKEQTLRSRDAVYAVGRLAHLVVGRKPFRRVIERGAAQQRDLGIAVEEDLLDVIVELVAIKRQPVGIFQQPRVPVRVGVFRKEQDVFDIIVVFDEMGQPASWLARAALTSGSPASAGVTSKTRPKTSLSATKAAAMPQLVRRKFRRLYPSFFAAPSANFLQPRLKPAVVASAAKD
jgi:hypothetical protein